MNCDLNDSLDDLFGGSPKPANELKQPPASYIPLEKQFEEKCTKCRGTGSWRPGYTCFSCKGKGKKIFKSSSEQRQRAKASSIDRKAKRQIEAIELFKQEFPDIWNWMDGSTFPFAVSLLEKVKKFGDLTENQIAAAKRCIASLEKAKEEKSKREACAPSVNINALEAAFAKASETLKKPKLRIGILAITKAKANSQNAGALYVKAGEEYLGKIIGGRFLKVRSCSDEFEQKVLAAVADPKTVAIEHGKLTGSCACCGRTLTNKESIDLGIGPICAASFGW